jgi:glycosyltransferase involved in cell wall biosynthesis
MKVLSVIKKVDLVMWTKNGAKTLPLVLKRIDKVIPNEVINNRMIVDDHSVDDSQEIAKSFGWRLILNEGKGISDGANTVLKQVETPAFISFEQDLFLAKNWWPNVSNFLSEQKVVVASGIRLQSQPLALKKLDEYVFDRCRKEDVSRSDKRYSPSRFGKSLDNTIYRTDFMRRIGGFPNLSVPAGSENVLDHVISKAGYEWRVNYDVASIHLRKDLRHALNQCYWYGTCSDKLEYIITGRRMQIKPQIFRLFFSPIRGLHAALRKNAPQVVYIYPLIRFNYMKGIFDGRKKGDSAYSSMDLGYTPIN